MTAAAYLIEARRLGVVRRIIATPTSPSTVIFGEALGRFAIAAVQAVLIIAGSSLLFGVDWGDPAALALIVVAFCLVASAAGMLLGSTLKNEQQAGAVALLLGLGLGALGGSMVPIDVFPDTMRQIAHITPHAWANDAFSKTLLHSGGISDIAVDLLVLVGFGVVLLAIASWRMRKVLTT
jgi:ABC-2 type transport system permease protein